VVRGPLRDEVWLVVLDPTQGSEIQKTRPCLVISPDEMNRQLRTVVIAPMTTVIRPDIINLLEYAKGFPQNT
jgi:mRNA interferase MazF